ncbi:hypothetical protein AJ80_08554 [Polytolypa hystricis UAMH7299]|uniref:Uncharacterized protein n=1 Tax=Polytolypa hystricis (strain UAMH7299) TaxID=1447883 RepID=A0A2B7X5P4_POLH7|nr:hypothetical protein AJ80_08554 [Polytolypa hystricis UAMH7299]
MLPHVWQSLWSTALLICALLATTMALTPTESFQNVTRETSAMIISLTDETSPRLLCRYPISGNYCTLPRALFYATIIAALVLRHHTWLFIGALAASLTYSGAAAIHVCLVIWSGRAWGELDIAAITAILSVSCIVTVPLLNWSSTIRNAGRPLQEDRRQREKVERLLRQLEQRASQTVAKTTQEEWHHRETFERRRRRLESRGRNTRRVGLDAAARTILLFWAFLVTVGFCCGYVALLDRTHDGRIGNYNSADESLATEIRCAPDGGELNMTAVLTFVLEDADVFVITSKFIETNSCVDPCPNFPLRHGPVLFRDEGDSEVYRDNMLDSPNPDMGKIALVNKYVFNMSWIIVYILIQGIWAIGLGPSEPSESRIRVYGFIIRMRLRRRSSSSKGGGNPPGRFHVGLATTMALIAYLWAVGIAIIAVPLLIVNVTVGEMYLYYMPHSEASFHVGSWGPFVTTGLALFSMIIASTSVKRRAGDLLAATVSNVYRLGSFVIHRGRGRHHRALDLNLRAYRDAVHTASDIFFTRLKDYIFEQRNDVVDSLTCEWHNTVAFWRNPDVEVSKLEARSETELEYAAEYAAGLPTMSPEPGPLASRPLLSTEMQNVEREREGSG